ncbi:MAG: hypothetical protein H5U01_00465 [Clostridia bacterium]|nr:hypothetical protein [Clostridia bacterium]
MSWQRESRLGGRAGGGEAWDKRLGEAACACDYSTRRQKDKMPVYGASGKVVGCIVDGWLEKRNLDPARHMLKKPPAWATDADHLDIPGLKGIRIVTVDGEVWEAPLSEFRAHGVPIERGHGRQVALPLRYWSRHKVGESETEGEAFQLALWAEVAP